MVLFVLFVVIILLVGINFQISSNAKALDKLKEELGRLRKELEQIRIQPKRELSDPANTTPTAVVHPVEKSPIKQESLLESGIAASNPVKPIAISTPEPAQTTFDPRPIPIDPESSGRNGSWWKQWLRENPDIEKFIGENLINKIGIAVLVLGISFFVKYAIDQDWINEKGRVGIGVFCGLVLLAIAHKLRKAYHSFSSVLVGGGLSVFYFTFAFAFHQYHLIGQEIAFILMVAVTALAILLSVMYDRLELAILAAIGGFITPFLVSTGQGNYQVLFTYLAILDAGLIVLAYFKRWRILNFISFLFTEGIYLAWIINNSDMVDFPYRNIFYFGGIFYGLFVIMNAIHHVSRGSKLRAFDFLMLFAVNFIFYASGIYLLATSSMGAYKGVFTASLGIVNLLLAWIFYRQSRADKNFINLLIGITISFISLAAPIQLRGNDVTLFWAAEMVVLLWLNQRSSIRFLKLSSAFLGILVLISLSIDWIYFYGGHIGVFPVFFNTGCITGTMVSIAFLLIYFLLRREQQAFYIGHFRISGARVLFLTSSMAILLISGGLEIFAQFHRRMPGTDLDLIYLELYVYAFFVLLFVVFKRYRLEMDQRIRLGLPLLVFFFYLLNSVGTYDTERQLLLTEIYRPYFFANWVKVGLLLVLCWSTIKFARQSQPSGLAHLNRFSWICTIALLVIVSLELRNAFVWLYYSDPGSFDIAENLYGKAGLTIIWALASFVIIWIGLTHKYKPLRIIALLLFGITLLKLFVYDIQHISPAGKILAFILLGALLLIISFMYQRLKRLIIDDINPS